MSPEAWKFWNDNWIWLLLFGGGIAAFFHKALNRILLAFDPTEVKLSRIEADRQIRIAQAENSGAEEEDYE